MVVLILKKCPVGLRGDITKWLLEVSPGVYVGNLSARVRDAIWYRVCKTAFNGSAALVYSANNEQGYKFRTHNTKWTIKSYEGLLLPKRPKTEAKATDKNNPETKSVPKESVAELVKESGESTVWPEKDIVVIDLETTGTNPEKDEIIEIGAVKVYKGSIKDRIQYLIMPRKPIPRTVRNITGINPLIIEKEGIGLKVGLKNLSKFIGDCTVIGYNVAFDCRFLEKAYDEQSMDFPITKVKDLLKLIKAKEKGLAGYQLKDVADHYHIKQDVSHRALADAETTAKIFIKLYEKGMIKI